MSLRWRREHRGARGCSRAAVPGQYHKAGRQIAGIAGLKTGPRCYLNHDQDGSVFGIYAQRYNVAARGRRVPSTNERTTPVPSIAALVDGGFVVIGIRVSIRRAPNLWQRYDANVNKVGGHVSIVFIRFQLTSSVFTPRWWLRRRMTTFDPSGSNDLIAAQRYSGKTKRVGRRIKVGLAKQDVRQYSNPKVAGLADGGFVAVWLTETTTKKGVLARRYNASGVAVGDVITVVPTTAGLAPINEPNAIALKDGSFVVTWDNRHSLPTGNPHVYGQRYTSTGARAGTTFRINTSGGCYACHSASDGVFVVSCR